jgi:hypothetical protein
MLGTINVLIYFQWTRPSIIVEGTKKKHFLKKKKKMIFFSLKKRDHLKKPQFFFNGKEELFLKVLEYPRQ